MTHSRQVHYQMSYICIELAKFQARNTYMLGDTSLNVHVWSPLGRKFTVKHYYPPGVWHVLGVGEEHITEGVLVPHILGSPYMSTLVFVWVATVHYCEVINCT